jgi:D-beta-D-heptose 7-phosphate kinase/D-beta-D-heptose 1-phosphate adenosyltransferase
MVSTRSPLIFFDRLPAYVRNKDGLPVPLDDCRRELVVANGCFDLLTVGHLKVLRTAASLAPYLLVAINSDVSVRSLKGPDRPFVPQEERAQLVASLCWVDAVAVFDGEEALERLLAHVRPAYLVKGAGSGPTPGAQHAGAVVYVPQALTLSTTQLAERIRRTATERIN